MNFEYGREDGILTDDRLGDLNGGYEAMFVKRGGREGKVVICRRTV